MSFNQFPARLDVRVLDTDETAKVGSFQTATDIELKYIRVKLYIQGTLGGTERMRAKVYGDADRTALLYTSAWSDLSDITGLSGTWLGWLRLDFSAEHLNKNIEYFLSIEIDNYTRNGDTFYVALGIDNIQKIYAGRFNNTVPCIEVYGLGEGN
jgi:hypothetical protein